MQPKHQFFFITEDELNSELKIKLKRGGIVNPDGTINWDCPCLGGMPTSACGEEFKATLTCLINSKKGESQGAECMEYIEKMHNCLQEHPELLPDVKKTEKSLKLE